MAFFIAKYLSGHKKKMLYLYDQFKTRAYVLLCNLKIIDFKSNFNYYRENINLYTIINTFRQCPVHLAVVLLLVAGLTWSGFAVAGAVFPAGAKQVSAAEMHAGRFENSTPGSNALNFERGASPRDISSSRDNQTGNRTSRGWINRHDIHLLAMVIEGEAANEPLKGKVAVGAVIINRAESGEFPRGVRNVVYQPWAFESVMNGQYTRPLSQDSIRAANMAVNGWDPTGGALYFWNPVTAKSKWVWQRPVTMQIGRHVFAK